MSFLWLLMHVDRLLKIRQAQHDNLRDPPLPIVELLIRAGFYGVSRLGWFEYNCPLVLAMVESRCCRTHTFHIVQGQTTITLEEVGVMLGLPCMGQVDPKELVCWMSTFTWVLVATRIYGRAKTELRLVGRNICRTAQWCRWHEAHVLRESLDSSTYRSFLNAG